MNSNKSIIFHTNLLISCQTKYMNTEVFVVTEATSRLWWLVSHPSTENSVLLCLFLFLSIEFEEGSINTVENWEKVEFYRKIFYKRKNFVINYDLPQQKCIFILSNIFRTIDLIKLGTHLDLVFVSSSSRPSTFPSP
jgi:ethanolamine ammonia-lyase large subunit